MNTVRPFKFEKMTSCCACADSAPVVAEGDDKGLTIAQLAEKYRSSLYGIDESVTDRLPQLVGKLGACAQAQSLAVNDHYEMNLHQVNRCAMLQGVKGKVVVTDNSGRETHIQSGETLLIPAATTLVEVDGVGEILLATL